MKSKIYIGPDPVHYFPSGLRMTTTGKGPLIFTAMETNERNSVKMFREEKLTPEEERIGGLLRRHLYPEDTFKSKKAWLRDVRKRWIKFRKAVRKSRVGLGAAYYPYKVKMWITAFDCDIPSIDDLMRDYYNDINN